ncbi:hypothetical protein M427DRAFT_420827 [Gonapodya prolifera JEL478]|uniref:Uncharacterized protein n=1 Tax=Gonapodya prolifera (strain JEL478) TaxID=1344416 RepID=A0A139A4G4_GONPJ|nr:hypothetical protein M427DRAFT_420827 [Gonapodya prolifera JEL478]|eukprot:KXS11680.1 hypothetical protein M427DRAFT_420827 [Gonapodya prolifera JEL478]
MEAVWGALSPAWKKPHGSRQGICATKHEESLIHARRALIINGGAGLVPPTPGTFRLPRSAVQIRGIDKKGEGGARMSNVQAGRCLIRCADSDPIPADRGRVEKIVHRNLCHFGVGRRRRRRVLVCKFGTLWCTETQSSTIDYICIN